MFLSLTHEQQLGTRDTRAHIIKGQRVRVIISHTLTACKYALEVLLLMLPWVI
jgi:hypothetical protein